MCNESNSSCPSCGWSLLSTGSCANYRCEAQAANDRVGIIRRDNVLRSPAIANRSFSERTVVVMCLVVN